MPQYDGSPFTQLSTPARNDVQGVIKDVSEVLPENQTKFALYEDILQFGAWASTVRSVTASGTVTLANTDPIYIEIDPNGADRDVDFPAKSDDNHAYVILHSGSANTLTLKRSGGATITTLAAGEAKYIMPSTLEDFTALAGGSSSSGGELILSSATVTTSNVTGVEGTLHYLDVSGLTANRDFNLPTPTAAGKRIGVLLSAGDDTYELLLKINGTEWSRIFITNEIVVFISVGTGAGDWKVEQDGRIPQQAEILNTGSQTISNATITKVTVDELVSDNANVADYITNYRFTVRRNGKYMISGHLRYNAFSAAATYTFLFIRKNGATYIAPDDRAPVAGSYPGFSPSTNTNLVVDDYVDLVTYQNSGASQSTIVTGGNRVGFSITEILLR